MIANATDDGANGGPEGLALWIVERDACGGLSLRRLVPRGPLRLGSVPLPPELLARCVPLDDDAAGREGA